MRAFDDDIEPPPSPAASRQMAEDQSVGLGGQPGVGVEEQQNLALCACGTRIHLRASAAWRFNDRIGQWARQLRRAVMAAAVRHDDFMAALAQRRQRGQLRRNPFRFIKRWHNDRQTRHRHVSRAARHGNGS